MNNRSVILAMTALPMLISASALSALPKSDTEDNSGSGASIRNAEINVDVNLGDVKTSGKDVNIANVQAGKDGISNIKINTAIDVGDIDAKKNMNIGNVTFEKGGAENRNSREAKKADNIANVNIESNRVTEVTTVIGASQSEKIKERNKANTLEDSDGVDSRGIKHNYVGKDEVKAAERASRKGEQMDVGNINVTQESGIKKVKTVIETLPGSKKSSSKTNRTDGEENEE